MYRDKNGTWTLEEWWSGFYLGWVPSVACASLDRLIRIFISSLCVHLLSLSLCLCLSKGLAGELSILWQGPSHPILEEKQEGGSCHCHDLSLEKSVSGWACGCIGVAGRIRECVQIRACHICNWVPLILWKSGISVADPPTNQRSELAHRNVNLCFTPEAGISPRLGFNRSRNPLMGNVTWSLIWGCWDKMLLCVCVREKACDSEEVCICVCVLCARLKLW